MTETEIAELEAHHAAVIDERRIALTSALNTALAALHK